MAEKTALFGDVEYLTADEKIVELVNSAKGNASATDAETTESTTDSSNYVDVDRDFSEAANDVYMAITDCFKLGGEDTLVLMVQPIRAYSRQAILSMYSSQTARL